MPLYQVVNKALRAFPGVYVCVGFLTLYRYYLKWVHYKLHCCAVLFNFVLHQQEQREQSCLKVIDMSRTAGSGKRESHGWRGHTHSHSKRSDTGKMVNVFPSIFIFFVWDVRQYSCVLIFINLSLLHLFSSHSVSSLSSTEALIIFFYP